MSELHWLIITRATADLVLLDAQIKSVSDIQEWVPEILEDLGSLPQAAKLLQSQAPEDVHAGLHLIASNTLDYDTFTFIMTALVEDMFVENLTVIQVVETLRLLDEKIQSGALTMTNELADVFQRDGFSLHAFPARLDAIRNGQSQTSIAELQDEVDQTLSNYIRL